MVGGMGYEQGSGYNFGMMNMIMIAVLVIIANILFCYFPSSVLILCKIGIIIISSSIIVIIICCITTINSEMGQGS